MTGYGRGESTRHGVKVTIEVSSVNRKQAEVQSTLPRELEPLEARIREEVGRRVSRGRVVVRAALRLTDKKKSLQAQLNVPLCRAVARQLAKLSRELKLGGGVSLEALVRVPGVVESSDAITNAEDYWPATQAALGQALARLLRMRSREGAHLARDLQARVAAMRKLAAAIEQEAPEVAVRYRKLLLERIRAAGLNGLGPDDERVVKEVVLFADRSDISEELTRLRSHFQQCEDCLQSREPVGRMLDFLAQELNREVSTIGAKASDSRIGRVVLTLKSEVERFREQAQNVQ
jgi:uncharacterized protein (TIGR00255 family)